MLTQENVKQLFDYDQETGILTRLISTSNKVRAGDIVGHLGDHGYLVVGIDHKLYRVHRIIWLWVYGEFPEGQTDHINHDRADNRISNLRSATGQENQRNISMRNDNTSGVMGVCWHKQTSKWRAQIKVDDKNIHLGIFPDKAEAIIARTTAEIKYGFHPNHGKLAQKGGWYAE